LKGKAGKKDALKLESKKKHWGKAAFGGEGFLQGGAGRVTERGLIIFEEGALHIKCK